MLTSQLEFMQMARDLLAACDRLGLTKPGFRAPPHGVGDRAIRRCPDGTVVFVRFVGRDRYDVARDLIDGVVAANPDLDAAGIELIRGQLWQQLGVAA